jgi:hypothetical protein
MYLRAWSAAVLVSSLVWAFPARANFLSPSEEKAGPFMFNLKLGPAFPIAIAYSGHSATLNTNPLGTAIADFGIAVDSRQRAYILLPIQFIFNGDGAYIMIPVGFQYDFHIWKNLFLYPRGFVGYTFYAGNNGSGGTNVQFSNVGVVAAELGLKWIFKKRWNVGFEPFSLPVVFNSNVAIFFYRLNLYGGVNF